MKAIDTFNLTMGLMRKIDDSGAINEATTKKFKAQAPYLISMLQAELLTSEGSTAQPTIVNNMEDTLLITDRTAMMILPYGLAAHLIIDQIPEKASYFGDRYEELKRKIPKSAQEIVDIYNTLEV